MTKHILEKLAQTNPECEIWWDSSPLVYASWRDAMLKKAPDGKKDIWRDQLKRLYEPKVTAKNGEMFFRGMTTNPPLSLGVLKDNPAYWKGCIMEKIALNSSKGIEQIYWMTYLDILFESAKLILPVWEKSGGKFGYISGQVDPRFVTDKDIMRAQALQIAALAPNIMVKVPGSKEGYEVIEILTSKGISTNNTTSFSVAQYVCGMQAVSAGLRIARQNGVDLSKWRSVITHMSARFGELGDLKKQAEARGILLSQKDILWAELAILKRAYHYGKSIGHPSKMLMCSMRVRDHLPGGLAQSWHIEKTAGSDMVYTCPPGYIAKLMEVEDRFADFDAGAINEEPPKEILEKLLKLPYFRQSYEFDGMRPEEFTHYAPFISTVAEFAAATRSSVDFVARQFESAQAA